ncbi:hypothetical protein Hanom_Chr06g00486381 [Helianthus anomalus]
MDIELSFTHTLFSSVVEKLSTVSSRAHLNGDCNPEDFGPMWGQGETYGAIFIICPITARNLTVSNNCSSWHLQYLCSKEFSLEYNQMNPFHTKTKEDDGYK